MQGLTMGKTIWLILWVYVLVMLLGCTNKNENILWTAFHNDIPNSVSFLEDIRKLLLYNDDSIMCYNLETGKEEWCKKLDNTCFPCAQYAEENNILYCDLGSPSGIYICNIDSGKGKLLLPLYIHMYYSVRQDSMLYIATSGTPKERPNSINGQHTISSYNLQTGEFRILYAFAGQLFNPMYVVGDSLILPIEREQGNALLCCINTHTGAVLWERDIPFRRVYIDNYYIILNKGAYHSLYFVDISIKTGMSLIEVNLETGKEINIFRLPIENCCYNNTLPNIHLECDGNYILIQTIDPFLFDIAQNKLIMVRSYLNTDIILVGLHKGKLIYTERSSVFAYTLKTAEKRKLLQLNKKILCQWFYSNNYILLILTKDFYEDIADHNNKTYIVLSM